jgi:hypothetical protein
VAIFPGGTQTTINPYVLRLSGNTVYLRIKTSSGKGIVGCGGVNVRAAFLVVGHFDFDDAWIDASVSGRQGSGKPDIGNGEWIPPASRCTARQSIDDAYLTLILKNQSRNWFCTGPRAGI